MKKLLSLATAGIIGTAALCSTAQAGQLTTADKEFLFNNPSVAKAETLSPEEMKNTEGAWGWWGFITGAIGGAVAYTCYWATTPNSWDWDSFSQHVATGAVLGALEPTPLAIATLEGAIAGSTEAIVDNAFHYNWDW